MSDPSGSEAGLRERIATLEHELEEAREGTKRPRASIETIGHQARNHHVEANLDHYGRTGEIVFLDPEKDQKEHIQRRLSEPNQFGRFHRFLHRYNFHEFAQRPVLHQWHFNGKMYREAKERVSSRFELFFDLLFVGIIHQIAESTAENPTGFGLAKYVLTFCPAYSIWSDVRDIVNQFANDDVTQRCYILWIMILLVGYSNNASSIELKIGETMTPEDLTSLRWTIGFFVMAKLSKVLLNTFYGYWLPMSRVPLLTQSFNSFTVGLLFFISAFLPPLGIYIIVPIAIIAEYAMRVIGILLLKLVERKKARRSPAASGTTALPFSEKSSGVNTPETEVESGLVGMVEGEFGGRIERARKQYRIPAINIEHHVDRLGAFVTIVLGEMVVNVFYHTSLATGLNQQSGRSILGLMVAFNLNWIYFDSEACRNFIHAIRRHWLTGLIFTTMHLPLSLSLLLASAAMNRLVVGEVRKPTSSSPSSSTEIHARADSPESSSTIPTGIYYFFGTGVGLSVICMAIIGTMHRNLDNCRPRGVLGLSRSFVIGTRFVMGLLMALLPIAHEKLTPLSMLGTYVAITGVLIMEETFSRLERVERERDVDSGEGKVVEDEGSSTT